MGLGFFPSLASKRRCWGCGFLVLPPARLGMGAGVSPQSSLCGGRGRRLMEGSLGQSVEVALAVYLRTTTAFICVPDPQCRRNTGQLRRLRWPRPPSPSLPPSPSSSLPASSRSLLLFHRSQSLFVAGVVDLLGPSACASRCAGLCELDPGRPGSHLPGPQPLAPRSLQPERPARAPSAEARLPHPQPAARPGGAQSVASTRQPGPGRRAA